MLIPFLALAGFIAYKIDQSNEYKDDKTSTSGFRRNVAFRRVMLSNTR